MDGHWVISRIDCDAAIWVNGEPIEFAVVEAGDQIRIGRHVFIIFL